MLRRRMLLAAAAASAVVLLAGTGLVACTRTQTPATAPRPTTAPLPGTIAFVHRDHAGAPDGQIYLAHADGRAARPLVRSATDDEDPWLAPDGRRLVFTRHTGGRPDQLFLVGVDGSGLRPLTPSGCPAVCSDAADGPAWSPDGGTIAFTRTVLRGTDPIPVSVEIWLVDVATAAGRRLTHGTTARVGSRLRAQDGYAGWSPDGSRVLYEHEEHASSAGLDQYTVMTVAADGTHPRSVTPNDVNGGQPTWAPDGSLIAFQSPPDDEGVTKALYTIRPDGTGMTSLTNTLDTNDSAHPTWSPDSRYIAFSHRPLGSAAASGAADLYVVGRDGSDPHPLAVTGADETDPSWGRAG